MFAKKVLSLILVIGSQLAVANAACVLTSSDGSTCTVGEDSVCSPGYYLSKSTDQTNYEYNSATPAGTGTYTKVIKYDGSECSFVTDETCSSNTDAGNISTGGLCVGDGKNPKVEVAFQNDGVSNYLIPKGDGGPFTDNSDETKTHIVVKSAANSFTLNSDFNSGDYEDCFTITDGKIMTSKENMCAETACDSYYSCTSGLCQISAESCKRAETGEESGACDPEAATNTCLAESYYVKSGKLYYCGTANVACTLQETPLGVFKDAATDGNYITCTRQEHVGRRRSVTPTYDYTCTSAPVSVDSSQCTAAGVGGLYYVADANGTKTYYVCIAATGAGIPLGTASEYMVDVGSTALFSIQDTEKFVILSFDADGNASIAQYNINGTAKSSERYKYTNSKGLIFARNASTKTTANGVEGVCDASGPLSTIREYKRDFCSSHDEEDKLTDIVEYFVAVDRNSGGSP